ncbi:MAG: SDR family oxidoreductase [Oligoflexales bacterium]
MNGLFRLDGKHVVLTGGSGILGQHFARGALQQGAILSLIDQNEEALHQFVEQLNPQSQQKIYMKLCDVSHSDSVEEAVFDIEEKMGPIHVLHNNAASKSKNPKDFFEKDEDFSVELWDQIMSVNLTGMFLMARAVMSRMRENRVRGSVIQTASIYGHVAPDQRIYEGSEYMGLQISSPAVYSASKAGVIGLTKYLAARWGEHGIRVNTLTPGGVESGQNQRFKDQYSARVPLGRMAKAEEMVGAMVFLASDASSYVTGHNLMVDGGLSCW